MQGIQARPQDFYPLDISKPKRIFYYSAILFIVLFRISFIFKGSRSFIDESRYSFSLRALDSLQKKDIAGFFYYLSSTSGRPGSAVINLIPAVIQGVLYFTFGINPDTPDSYLVPLLFNCLVLAGSMYLLYKIALLMFGNQEIALAVVVIYSCLTNTNVYVNHLLPYDIGILISLLIIFRILSVASKNLIVTKFQAFEIGALAMLLFAEYPGYYLMLPTAGLMLVNWRQLFSHFSKYFLLALAYVGGVFAVFCFFEGMARLGGVSYVERSSTLSETITQGSFEEGFSFIVKYLYQVEGFIGIILIISTIFAVASVAVFISKHSLGEVLKEIGSEPKYILLICVISGFLFHAFLGYFFHKAVFYGRLIHPYILYIVLFCVGSTVVKFLSFYRNTGVLVSLAALLSFVLFSIRFIELDYPRDLLYKYKIDTTSPAVYGKDEMAVKYPLYHYQSPMVFRKGQKYAAYSGHVILVNCSLIFPWGNFSFVPYTAPSGSHLLYEGKHFAAFPAYTFEGLDIPDRNFVSQHDFKIKLYTTN